MSEPAAEFVVSGIVAGEELLGEPYLAVIGRCGDAPIHYGDHLRFVVRVDEPQSLEDFEHEPVEFERQDMDLTVRAIHSYGHERQELDRGMTGMLFLTGTGLESVKVGSVLQGAGIGTETAEQAVVKAGHQ